MSTNEISKLCPCCGKEKVREYDICSICSWENDPIQEEHPDMRGGANIMSLNEARRAYKNGSEIR
nr:MAG TPA: cysteine-rich protein [Caudoviricetes sp.]